MFTIILVGGNVAVLMNNFLNNQIEMGYPFEIMVDSPDKDFSKYKDYIEKNTKIKDIHEYKLYYIDYTDICKALDGTMFDGRDFSSVLSLTDYNRLREILGYSKLDLKEDEIIINCLKTAKEPFEKYIEENNTLEILNNTFKIKELRTENLAQLGFNGYFYAIIVPDNFIPIIDFEEQKALEYDNNNAAFSLYGFGYKLAVQTKEPTDQNFYNNLCKFILKKDIEMEGEFQGEKQNYTVEISLGNVQTRGNRVSEVKSFYTIISFLAFYIALIFVMATATLLAIQQLSDLEKYKYRYKLLKKLGMDELEMNKIIFKQLLFYFVLPLVIPIIITVPMILGISNIFKVALENKEIWMNLGIILGLFMIVYGIYFIATNIQFNRNINGNR